MRAIIFREHSPSLNVYEYITDLPRPEPAADAVLVRVGYAGLNRLDDFETVMKLVFAGKIEPPIDSIHPMVKFRRGMERMLDGAHFGKILFKLEDSP